MERQANDRQFTESDPLTIKMLTENLKRFELVAKPYLAACQTIADLVTWKSPVHSLLVFLVYMYFVWNDAWFFPAFMLCLTFPLVINFLQHSGYQVRPELILPPLETTDSVLRVSFDGLVKQIARKVQNLLGAVADVLEKVKSLVTWKYPLASNVFLGVVSTVLTLSLLLPATTILRYIGLILGIKVFVIDLIYVRFPNVVRKRNLLHQLWLDIPTDSKEERETNNASEADIDSDGESFEETTIGSTTEENEDFLNLFELPANENPLAYWGKGRKCTMSKDLGDSKTGRLYLTRSNLCFERTKNKSNVNVIIKLANIQQIEKSGDMEIEIAVEDGSKSYTYIFGGLYKLRDRVYGQIRNAVTKRKTE